jgi:ferric-dicitrate binding protein FerR (iron transport regulator)
MNKDYKELLRGYLNNSLTVKELQLFIELSRKDQNGEELSSSIESSLTKSVHTTTLSPDVKERLFESILKPEYGKTPELTSKRIHHLWKYAAAASVIGLIFAISNFFIKTSADNKDSYAAIKKNNEKQTLVSGSLNQTTLTLADGSKVLLDDVGDGELTQQGDTKIIKLKSGLIYNNGKNSGVVPGINLLTTPKGIQYQLVLEDGTKVWLNASSSLKFPTAFTGNQRVVELMGEAYFEVAKNPGMPFKVKAKNSEIQVLGTHFNINSYDDENAINTTLLEGSVKITHSGKEKILRPGQQAQSKSNGELSVKSDVSINEIIAWKNGVFQFKNSPISAILREVERWYDVDFVNQAPANMRFTGVIKRNVSLEEFLKFLEVTQTIRFQRDGKKITVF